MRSDSYSRVRRRQRKAGIGREHGSIGRDLDLSCERKFLPDLWIKNFGTAYFRGSTADSFRVNEAKLLAGMNDLGPNESSDNNPSGQDEGGRFSYGQQVNVFEFIEVKVFNVVDVVSDEFIVAHFWMFWILRKADKNETGDVDACVEELVIDDPRDEEEGDGGEEERGEK